MNRLKQWLLRWIMHGVGYYIIRNLPPKIKRTVMIGSLLRLTSACRCRQDAQRNVELLNRINEMLRNPHDPQVLFAPLFVCRLVWERFPKEETSACGLDTGIHDRDDLERVTQRLFTCVPSWIRYAPDSFVMRDIQRSLLLIKGWA